MMEMGTYEARIQWSVWIYILLPKENTAWHIMDSVASGIHAAFMHIANFPVYNFEMQINDNN